jgi:tRNA dimethylallyltransferase
VTLHIVAIVGPTATGKTRLGVEVAHRFESEILSADARQVYRGLDLGTGKDLEEYAAVTPAVPYHLIDIANPADVFTVFDYQQACFELLRRKASDEPFGSGRVPLVMVGGSGLYVEAVLRGYRIADVPEDPGFRASLRGTPVAELRDRLRRADPDLAERTDLGSAKRIIRALEIVAAGGSQGVSHAPPLDVPARCSVFGIRVDREALRQRIADRVADRLEHGMIDEVRRLHEGGLSWERLDMLGLEYREISAHLRGEVDRRTMIERLVLRIGQFAKRQQTYFRGMERRGIPVRWIEPGDVETVVRTIQAGSSSLEL